MTTEMPLFYREKGSNVVLETDYYDEIGDTNKTYIHLSEKTAKRLLSELTKAINTK